MTYLPYFYINLFAMTYLPYFYINLFAMTYLPYFYINSLPYFYINLFVSLFKLQQKRPCIQSEGHFATRYEDNFLLGLLSQSGMSSFSSRQRTSSLKLPPLFACWSVTSPWNVPWVRTREIDPDCVLGKASVRFPQVSSSPWSLLSSRMKSCVVWMQKNSFSVNQCRVIWHTSTPVVRSRGWHRWFDSQERTRNVLLG